MREGPARVLDALRRAAGRSCSGPTLSVDLGRSRAQVWKHVETLRSLGYGIQAAAETYFGKTAAELDFLEAVCGGEKRLSFARPGPEGEVRRETLTVRIPPGVADGVRIRLRGKGGAGFGEGLAGDLYARVCVRSHPIFRREGRDVYFDLPLGVSEATLGAQVTVPTLDGRATLTVPAGTDSGAKLRLRGKGVPDPSGGAAGDLYAVVQIRVPRGRSPETAEQLAKLDTPSGDELRKGLW